jgi:hypothetical protein
MSDGYWILDVPSYLSEVSSWLAVGGMDGLLHISTGGGGADET